MENEALPKREKSRGRWRLYIKKKNGGKRKKEEDGVFGVLRKSMQKNRLNLSRLESEANMNHDDNFHL